MKELGIELKNEDGTPGEFGNLWNIGDYYYNGEKIDDTDIARLSDFYNMNGRRAETLDEAYDFLHNKFLNM